MTTQLIPFQFGSNEVRFIPEGDSFSVVAKDVLISLEYAADYNPSRATAHVPEEWKGVHRMHTPGGIQEMLTLKEQGLYFFVNRSDKPKALPLQKWVAGDVLPTIRQTGGYGAALEAPKPRPSVAVLADSPYPRLHDQLNKALTLLTRPTSRAIKQVAFAQAQQLCEQLGIAAMEGETLPDFTARAHAHKKPSSVDDQVMLYLERRKHHGAGKRDLSRECYAFCKLHKLDQDMLLQRLLDQGRVVMVTRHRAPIFVATPFAEIVA